MTKEGILTALLLMVLAPSAFSIELINSWPEEGAVLRAPLKSLHLWFDRAPETSTADIQILGSQARPVVRGLHAMGSNDLMGLVDGAMPDGDYKLSWSIGDSEGAVRFSVARGDDYVDDQWELPLDIGIVLYDGAEPLDVFGPLEMWMNAGPNNIRVHLISQEAGPVTLTTTSYPLDIAPTIQAQHSFDAYPDLDVIMVPGGIGTLTEAENPAMLGFLRKVVKEVAVTTSVCTGSGLLASAGLLEGVEATGNKAFFDYLVSLGDAEWRDEARWIESGRFFTSSGVSAGMDMSLAVIARFFGQDIARMIADSTEYVWNEDPALDPFLGNLNTAVPYVDWMRENFEQQQEAGE
ncbi:MAG: DJ-1/PfpI family protein [Pseudomonadota bacterium]